MPDQRPNPAQDPSEFSEKDIDMFDRATAHAERYWKDPECPICKTRGARNWVLPLDVVEWPVAEKPLQVYPAIQFFCRTCGFIVAFNAFKAGISDPATSVSASEDESGAES